jgi:adenylate cyclase
MSSNADTLATKIVARADVRAERLISLLRMALATMLFMGVSYVLSQSGAAGLEGRQTELNVLRLGAVAYFLIGATNFYFSNALRFRPWMSWVFNCAEVLLVSFQLYVDVSDPLTPSLLAFASPVLLIVALVICVQALRSQVLLHVATSVLLLALCGIVLFHNPQLGTPFSDAAVSELQAVNSLPPTVMRLLMLIAMAGVIGTAVYKTKQLVERVGRETEIAENRKRFIPNEISNAMSDLDIEALRLGRETDLAVLFVDIRGFTAMAERASPRETAELLSEFRGLVTDAAIENDGIVDKFIGDGALLIFGLHSDISQAAHDALAGAKNMLRAIERWNVARATEGLTAIDLAVGVHAGPAIIGAVGDTRRLEFTAIGTTVNLAARLEETAKKHNKRLVVSRSTFDLIGPVGDDFTWLGHVDLRGSSQAIEVLALQ